jgi:hypothetical protein
MAGGESREPDAWSAVIWNLDEAKHPKQRSWEALSAFDADVALLSEARIPPGVEPVAYGKTIGRDCKHAREEECDGRPWSTAIVSRHELSEIKDAKARRYGKPLAIPFTPSRPGTWIAATMSMREVEDVTVVSLYGLTDEKSDASVHRSLSDLEPIFEDSDYNARLLLGGDLNIFANPRADDPVRERHLLVLERITAYGLVDLLERDLVQRDPPRGGLKDCPCRTEDCLHTWTFRSQEIARWDSLPRRSRVRFSCACGPAQVVQGGRLRRRERPRPNLGDLLDLEARLCASHDLDSVPRWM